LVFFSFFKKEDVSSKFTPQFNILLENSTLRIKNQERTMYRYVVSIYLFALGFFLFCSQEEKDRMK
jgi:hypothetical protein